MDEQQSIQEDESIVKQNTLRLKRYFRYLEQRSKPMEAQCMSQTNQCLQQLDKRAQYNQQKLTQKTTGCLIGILQKYLSLLGIYQEHKATVSQYKMNIKRHEQIAFRYEQLTFSTLRPCRMKAQLKQQKYLFKELAITDNTGTMLKNKPHRRRLVLLDSVDWKTSIKEESDPQSEAGQQCQ